MNMRWGLLVMAACGGAPAKAPVSHTNVSAAVRSIEVQGHRGARANYPENTLPAFTHALTVGVDTLELDVSVTKDDRIVVLHDLTINEKLCLGPGGARLAKGPAVRSLTLDEVKSYDCGSLKNERFSKQVPIPETKIPTLKEVFELVTRSDLPAAKQVKFNIEFKSVPAHPELTPSLHDFVAMVLAEIRAHGMTPKVTLQSFDHRTLVMAKNLEPSIKTSALIEGTLPNLAHMAQDLRVDVVSPNLDWVTREDVEALHAKNVRVIPWTANTATEWDYLIGIGVDGIISDDPGELIAYLKSRGLR